MPKHYCCARSICAKGDANKKIKYAINDYPPISGVTETCFGEKGRGEIRRQAGPCIRPRRQQAGSNLRQHALDEDFYPPPVSRGGDSGFARGVLRAAPWPTLVSIPRKRGAGSAQRPGFGH